MSGPVDSSRANEELKKYDKLKDEQARSDLKWVLEDPRGRRAMYRTIFTIAGAESLSYTGASDSTNFREGRRDVGLTLIRELQECATELYLLMLSEAITEASEVALRIKRITEESNARADGPEYEP